MIPDASTTPGGWLLPLAILMPFVGVLAGLALGGRHARSVAMLTIAAGLAAAIAIASAALRMGDSLVYVLGGWSPPLGIALRADGIAVAMIVAVAVVITGIGIYARTDFATPRGVGEARAPMLYWMLLLAVWGSLNLVFVSGDLFTLYVALELLTFAGVPLVCLDGKGETLRAALRYLVYALAGSVLYLLGVVLLYAQYGTLDIALLAPRVSPGAATWTAMAMMTAGLLAKTALFPLHLWLPPAHAGAPPAASAVLSALVVKGSFFIVIRLWLDVAPGLVGLPAAQLLAGLGAAAILFGSVIALRQARLKLLIAYSTLAQIGYLFIMFPLAFDGATGMFVHGDALNAGILQAISHATAKAAMFMAAGLVYKSCGHDRIADLAGIARASPLTVLTFVFGGVALMGVLPSGAYLAKKLLLAAADGSGQWWWESVLVTGGLLTTSYVVLVAAQMLRRPAADAPPRASVPRPQELAALALALCSLALGLTAVFGPVPSSFLGNPLAPKELGATLMTIAGGTVLALLFASPLPPLPAALSAVASRSRRVTLPLGAVLEGIDALLRRWAVAGVSLLLVALAFGLLMHGDV